MNKKILPAAVAAVCTAATMNGFADPKPPGHKGSGGGAAEYEFVDGNGASLGDVVFIEDRFHAFGYFNYLSTDSIIEVIATVSKQGEPINGYRFAGNFIRKNVLYADNLCTTTGYTNGGSREIGMLDFLQSDTYIYWPNTAGTTWTELVLSDVPAPSGTLDWYWKEFSDSPCEFSFSGDISSWAAEIGSYGDELYAPTLPILIVEKP